MSFDFLYSPSQLSEKVVLYGSGPIALYFFEKFKKFDNVVVVDDFKYGKYLSINNYKFKIHHPKIIKKLYKNYQIVVTSRYLNAFKKKLRKIKFLVFFIDYSKKHFFKLNDPKRKKIKLIKKFIKLESLELYSTIIDIKTKKQSIHSLHNFLKKKPFKGQYESYFPKKTKDFIDVGYFDGLTSYNLIKKYKSIRNIIAIDAFNLKKNFFFKFLNKKVNFKFLKFAASNKKKIDKIYFHPVSTDNSIKFKTNKFKLINFDKIDNKIKELNKESFIKFDIEGAELEALKGMKKLIQKFKPNLAISIYHGKNDIFEIPYYLIKNYNKYYKFKIKHYSFGHNETVMYAIKKK